MNEYVNERGVPLDITKTIDDGTMHMAVKGRINTITAPDFETAIQEDIDKVTRLDIDFADLDYLSSAGLRVILGAQKAMAGKGEMVIHNVNETVMEVFEVTGFATILTIE